MSNYKNGKLTEAEIFDIVGATPEGRSERAMNVGEIMGQIMKESNLMQQILEHRAESLWTQVVGPTVAHSTSSVYVRKGILFVGIRSSVIRAHLSMLKSDIISAINTRLGDRVVNDVIFR